MLKSVFKESASVIGSILQIPFFYFLRGLTSTLIFQMFLLIVLAAFKYVVDENTATDTRFFLSFGLDGFLLFALNVALIYTFTLILFRGYISPLLFMIMTMLFGALIKYLTGSLLLGMHIHDYIMIIPTGGYIFIMTYADAMLRGELQTAITYRTTDDD